MIFGSSFNQTSDTISRFIFCHRIVVLSSRTVLCKSPELLARRKILSKQRQNKSKNPWSTQCRVRSSASSLHTKDCLKLLLPESSTLNRYGFSIFFLPLLEGHTIPRKLIYSGFRYCDAAIEFKGGDLDIVLYEVQDSLNINKTLVRLLILKNVKLNNKIL
jgi:hypothetical protein